MFLPAGNNSVNQNENAPVPSQLSSANDKDREESPPVGPSTDDNVDEHQTSKQTTTATEERVSDYPEGAEGTFPLIFLILFRFYPNNTHLFVKNLKGDFPYSLFYNFLNQCNI